MSAVTTVDVNTLSTATSLANSITETFMNVTMITMTTKSIMGDTHDTVFTTTFSLDTATLTDGRTTIHTMATPIKDSFIMSTYASVPVSSTKSTTITLMVTTSTTVHTSELSNTTTSSMTFSPTTVSINMPSASLVSTTIANGDAGDTSNDGGSDSSVGIFVGCVIGSIFCLALMLLVIILVCYYKKSKKANFVVAQGMLTMCMVMRVDFNTFISTENLGLESNESYENHCTKLEKSDNEVILRGIVMQGQAGQTQSPSISLLCSTTRYNMKVIML